MLIKQTSQLRELNSKFKEGETLTAHEVMSLADGDRSGIFCITKETQGKAKAVIIEYLSKKINTGTTLSGDELLFLNFHLDYIETLAIDDAQKTKIRIQAQAAKFYAT